MQVTDDTPPKCVNTSTDDVQLLTPFSHKGTTPSSSSNSPSEPSQSPRRPLDDFLDTSQKDAVHSDSKAEHILLIQEKDLFDQGKHFLCLKPLIIDNLKVILPLKITLK